MWQVYPHQHIKQLAVNTQAANSVTTAAFVCIYTVICHVQLSVTRSVAEVHTSAWAHPLTEELFLTSTIVFYRTRVYQMQPRNGQNWHSFVGKYVHQNRDTAKIEFCTSRKSISISCFVDTRDKVNAD